MALGQTLTYDIISLVVVTAAGKFNSSRQHNVMKYCREISSKAKTDLNTVFAFADLNRQLAANW